MTMQCGRWCGLSDQFLFGHDEMGSVRDFTSCFFMPHDVAGAGNVEADHDAVRCHGECQQDAVEILHDEGLYFCGMNTAVRPGSASADVFWTAIA